MASAYAVRVRGVVQGVGFRPFVFRLAHERALAGWVLNAGEGVDMHLEGADAALDAFLRDLETRPPPSAVITAIEVKPSQPEGLREFIIKDSRSTGAPTACISPDLPVCADCLRELFDPADRRCGYPYITCTNCGPRYSVILALPYDRPNTTMKDWVLDARCASEYHDPADRRFHAQPVACPDCGPGFTLHAGDEAIPRSDDSIRRAAELLAAGRIVAVKGLGGYHLSCDARSRDAIAALRERKYRKEQPFALMARDLAHARELVRFTAAGEAALISAARPIVVAPARAEWPGVAPDNRELGVMLPYTPLHHLLFAWGAPPVLVMTSGNRSSEPIAYRDDDAMTRLEGIADAFLVGERPIARRVDDSVVRDGPGGLVVLRRARGYSPGVVAALPATRPILAVGADLKNAVTLVVAGQAIVSQHIGNLEHYDAARAFEATVSDLLAMYHVRWSELIVVHDAHPEYASTVAARAWPAGDVWAVQHHRAHVASVVAERQELEATVVGIALDGTGYGDDGAIWGGECFIGSVAAGFERHAHLRPARLVGGDAAARHPVQAAAGFLADIDGLPDLSQPPFRFPARHGRALELVRRNIRTFPTTSMGRLFDAAAALLGFTREISFEGQAAMWLEHLASAAPDAAPYPFPFDGRTLDWRPLLHAMATDRRRGAGEATIARAFHGGVARGVAEVAVEACRSRRLDTVACSGGVFQNALLLADVSARLTDRAIRVWTNHAVPPNDGGISLGQAALAAARRTPALTS